MSIYSSLGLSFKWKYRLQMNAMKEKKNKKQKPQNQKTPNSTKT